MGLDEKKPSPLSWLDMLGRAMGVMLRMVQQGKQSSDAVSSRCEVERGMGTQLGELMGEKSNQQSKATRKSKTKA